MLAEGYQAHHARVEFPGNSAATPVTDGPAGVGLHRSPQLASLSTIWKLLTNWNNYIPETANI